MVIGFGNNKGLNSKHELAKMYMSKGENIFEYELIDGDRVKLTGVRDNWKDRVVIPSFITESGFKGGNYNK